jgi:hypothetical protein
VADMLKEIKSAIKEIAGSVEGIGNVYERYLYPFDLKQLKDFFESNGKINTLMFRFTQRESNSGEGFVSELYVRRLWKFRLVYGYNYNNDSENSFDELCEAICKSFNSNLSLNGFVRKHTLLNVTDKYDSEYHGVLVHNAEMEMETES